MIIGSGDVKWEMYRTLVCGNVFVFAILLCAMLEDALAGQSCDFFVRKFTKFRFQNVRSLSCRAGCSNVPSSTVDLGTLHVWTVAHVIAYNHERLLQVREQICAAGDMSSLCIRFVQHL